MRTVLYSRHIELGAKIVEFGGWEMPICYKGILPEHKAVRDKVGIFDVSHMGQIHVTGKDAERFLNHISTSKIEGKGHYTATYTVWPLSEGGCVDDVITYKINEFHYFICVNASNREKDLNYLKAMSEGFHVDIKDLYTEAGIIAVQGPNAEALLAPLFLEIKYLKKMHFLERLYNGKKIIISRSGYTGADGFEIYAPNSLIVELWDYCLNEGHPFGLECAGLGARDTLRLEMGYALYGHELSDSISVNESVSAWTISWDKGEFIGSAAMKRLEASGFKRREQGIILKEKGIAREGYEVFYEGNFVGNVTSGNYAPSLGKSVAIVLFIRPLPLGVEVEVKIRQNFVKAEVCLLPFFKQGK